MSVGWAEMGRGKSWDIICLKTERRRYAYIYKDILNKLPMCLISSRISPKTIVMSLQADCCPCLQKRGVQH